MGVVEMGHHLSMTILTMAPLEHPEDVGVGVVEDVAISEMDPLEEVRETQMFKLEGPTLGIFCF